MLRNKNNRTGIGILVAVLLVLSVSVSVFAETDILKESDPIPEGDSYGAYYAFDKVNQKAIDFFEKRIAVNYNRTENLKSMPVEKRSDSYGTYDVYVDSENTEYIYLFDTDLLCGIKKENVGTATEQKNSIPQEKAQNIAYDYLSEIRDNHSDYKLIECKYSELNGYYDISYMLPIDGQKSDDVFRIWVDSNGSVTSFSEFNYLRYDGMKLDQNALYDTKKKIDEMITDESKDMKTSVVDEYVSVDDEGDLVVVKVVDFTISDADNSMIERKVLTLKLV